MSDYINREDAVDELQVKVFHNLTDEYYGTMQVLTELPAADVVPVVHGHWEYKYDTYCGFKDIDVRCSVCKTTTNIKRFRKTKWCPDCGAKMDGMREQIIEHGG